MLSIGDIEAQIDYINMKTFRLLGMAIIAILISLNFASCSSDDEGEETNSEYKLLMGNWEDVRDSSSINTYSFKSNSTYTFHHIEKPNGGNEKNDDWSGKFTYDANAHKITCYEGNSNVIIEELFIVEVNSTTLKLREWKDNDYTEVYTRK